MSRQMTRQEIGDVADKESREERQLRRSAIWHLRRFGVNARLPDQSIATACVYFHRYFLYHDLAATDRRSVLVLVAACLLLASKVEETPKKLKDILVVLHTLVPLCAAANSSDVSSLDNCSSLPEARRSSTVTSGDGGAAQVGQYASVEEVSFLARQIRVSEMDLLQTISFELAVVHPYKFLIQIGKSIGCPREVLRHAWVIVNDLLHTLVWLSHRPEEISVAAIVVAARSLGVAVLPPIVRASVLDVCAQVFELDPAAVQRIVDESAALSTGHNLVDIFDSVDLRRRLNINVAGTTDRQLSSALDGSTVWLNPTTGSDANSGLDPLAPVATFARALSLAAGGSVSLLVHVQCGVYSGPGNLDLQLSAPNTSVTLLGDCQAASPPLVDLTGALAGFLTVRGAGSTLAVVDLTLVNGYAPPLNRSLLASVAPAGSVFAVYAATLLLDGVRVAGSSGAPAVLSNASSLSVRDAEFVGCTTGGPGACLLALGGAVQLVDSTFRNSSAGCQGGAVATVDAAAQVRGCLFVGNEVTAVATTYGCAAAGGGAVSLSSVHASDEAVIELSDCRFVGNAVRVASVDVQVAFDTPLMAGGAAYLLSISAPLRLHNCSFAANGLATSVPPQSLGVVVAGGALHVETRLRLVLTDCQFDDNWLQANRTGAGAGQPLIVLHGAAVNCYAAGAVVANCSFVGNAVQPLFSATDDVFYALVVRGGTALFGGLTEGLAVSDCLFRANSALLTGLKPYDVVDGCTLAAVTGGQLAVPLLYRLERSLFVDNHWLAAADQQWRAASVALHGQQIAVHDCHWSSSPSAVDGGQWTAPFLNTSGFTVLVSDCSFSCLSPLVSPASNFYGLAVLFSPAWLMQRAAPDQRALLQVSGCRFAGFHLSANGVSGALLYAWLTVSSPFVHLAVDDLTADNVTLAARQFVDGGLIYCQLCSATVRNAHIAAVDVQLASNGTAFFAGGLLSLTGAPFELSGLVVADVTCRLAAPVTVFGALAHFTLQQSGQSGALTAQLLDTSVADVRVRFAGTKSQQLNGGVVSVVGSAPAALLVLSAVDVSAVSVLADSRPAVFGALLASTGVQLQLTDVAVTDCHADCAAESGGGIVDSRSATVSVAGAAFVNNTAPDCAAVWLLQTAAQSSSHLDDLLAADNSARSGFLLVSAGAGANVSVAASTFVDNTALLYSGGSVYFVGAPPSPTWLTVNASHFRGSFSPASGGALAVDGAALALLNCTFDGNAADRGGAVAVDASSSLVSVQHTTFARNAALAGGGGGALSLVNSSADVASSSFTGNAAAASGSAVALVDVNSTAVFSRCAFAGNAGAAPLSVASSGAVADARLVSLAACSFANHSGVGYAGCIDLHVGAYRTALCQTQASADASVSGLLQAPDDTATQVTLIDTVFAGNAEIANALAVDQQPLSVQAGALTVVDVAGLSYCGLSGAALPERLLRMDVYSLATTNNSAAQLVASLAPQPLDAADARFAVNISAAGDYALRVVLGAQTAGAPSIGYAVRPGPVSGQLSYFYPNATYTVQLPCANASNSILIVAVDAFDNAVPGDAAQFWTLLDGAQLPSVVAPAVAVQPGLFQSTYTLHTGGNYSLSVWYTDAAAAQQQQQLGAATPAPAYQPSAEHSLLLCPRTAAVNSVVTCRLVYADAAGSPLPAWLPDSYCQSAVDCTSISTSSAATTTLGPLTCLSGSNASFSLEAAAEGPLVVAAQWNGAPFRRSARVDVVRPSSRRLWPYVLIGALATLLLVGLGVGAAVWRRRRAAARHRYQLLPEAFRNMDDSGQLRVTFQQLLDDPHVKKIEWRDLAFEAGCLGQGASGSVWKAQWRGRGVAVKRLNIGAYRHLSEEDVEDFRREIVILAALSHPNVLAFHGVSVVQSQHFELALVTELCSGDLQSLLEGDARLSLAFRVQLALDVARGMKYLHKMNVIHRDLKPTNVLVSAAGVAKVADFGISTLAPSQSAERTMTKGVGSPMYTAPEVFQQKRYTGQCDVYSYGMTLLFVVTRAEPFSERQDLSAVALVTAVLRDDLRPCVPDSVPEIAAHLVKECLNKQPDFRPSFKEIIIRLTRLLSLMPRLEQHDDADE